MAFKFVDKKGKEIKNQNISWKFKNHKATFSSDPERFDRNVAYWKGKLALAVNSEVEILNGDIEIEVPQTLKIENYVNNTSNPVAAVTAIESPAELGNDQPDAQQDLSELFQDIIDTPKRKSRPKTS